MMPGMGMETSLVEASYALMWILLALVGIALLAGIFTLPIFYGALGYQVLWFRAGDASSGSRWRRNLVATLRDAMPLFSLFATMLTLSYFGAFDWPMRITGAIPPQQVGPMQRTVKNTFDEITRGLGERSNPSLPTEVKINWARRPDKAKELVELWNAEQAKKPPDPLGPLFPPAEAATEPPTGPLPVPKAVTEWVTQLIAQERDGTLYTANNAEPVPREVLGLADFYFERTVKDSKAKQEKGVQAFRSYLLYVLLILGPIPLCVFVTAFVLGRRGVILGMRNIIRALLRTSLTYLAVFVLVFVLCCIWSVLAFLSAITTQKDTNMKGIITEKYQIPSQMKPSHLATVKSLIAELPDGQRPDNVEDNIMTWAFVGGTLDPAKRTPQNSIFFFATEPEKLVKMMPGLDELSAEDQQKIETITAIMAKDPKGVVIGAEKLRQMGKRVGDRMKLTSMNYREIEFDFTIVGEFPTGSRWDQSAVMNRRYLDNELDAYRGRTGKDHALADKSMNLIWVRLPNPQAFDTLSAKLNDPGKFSPAIKMEIESSAYANFLSPFKTLLWFMKYPLSIGLLTITTLVASLVIGIGVRERKTEIAVLKVLGFRPWMVLGLVLGEALLVGLLSGFMATATAFTLVNAMGGLSLGIAFFQRFFIPEDALWWGPLIGGMTALIGAILPSFSAYRIKASQVFSRVT
jgi:putative ABC transport system permease protein